MRLSYAMALVPIYASLVTALSTTQDQCTSDDSQLLVGASVVTILPTVEGSTAYFDDTLGGEPLALEPGDPGTDPGVFVEEWDVGTIAIGNGYPTSHWAHDEIRAGAVAFKDLTREDDKTLVMVTADVYMLFRQDMEEIFDRVRTLLGDNAFEKLHIVVSATHNHMGPDTSGLDAINPGYYRYLCDQIARAIATAVDENRMRPAELRVAKTTHQFGQSDGTAPYIVDPTLNVMQAVDPRDGSTIVTLFQWQNHPETTLGYGRHIYATEEQAEYLRSIDECHSDDDGATCYMEGQYISGGFAGYAAWRVMEETGAPAMYFNGAVGAMQTPLDATVWETEGEGGMPVGDGVEIPEGATVIAKSFHKLAVIGDELGKAVLDAAPYAEIVIDPPVSMVKQEFYTPLVNWGFKVGMVVGPAGQPLMLGYNPRELYNCADGLPRNDENCVSDEFETVTDPILHVPVRAGDYLKTEVQYLKIGPVGMITIPGEGVAEIVEGLPSDFYTDPRDIYYVNDDKKANHATGTDYDTAGYVRQAMNDDYKWTLGLTMDEVGYMVPISDWRIFCMADEEDFGGTSGNCKTLYDAGIMDFEDYDGQKWSMSGEHCKTLRENPELLEGPPYTDVENGATWAEYTCTYGTTWNEPDDHYEQTMSAGWDATGDWTEAAKTLLGWEGELEDVNPDFVANNQPPK